MVSIRPKSPAPALANLAIAMLLLALAALVLVILNRISTHPELISTCLAALNKMGNSDAMTISLRLAMSENKRFLTCARFFEEPYSSLKLAFILLIMES